MKRLFFWMYIRLFSKELCFSFENVLEPFNAMNVDYEYRQKILDKFLENQREKTNVPAMATHFANTVPNTVIGKKFGLKVRVASGQLRHRPNHICFVIESKVIKRMYVSSILHVCDVPSVIRIMNGEREGIYECFDWYFNEYLRDKEPEIEKLINKLDKVSNK